MTIRSNQVTSDQLHPGRHLMPMASTRHYGRTHGLKPEVSDPKTLLLSGHYYAKVITFH
jgi:hypothetical protein